MRVGSVPALRLSGVDIELHDAVVELHDAVVTFAMCYPLRAYGVAHVMQALSIACEVSIDAPTRRITTDARR